MVIENCWTLSPRKYDAVVLMSSSYTREHSPATKTEKIITRLLLSTPRIQPLCTYSSASSIPIGPSLLYQGQQAIDVPVLGSLCPLVQ